MGINEDGLMKVMGDELVFMLEHHSAEGERVKTFDQSFTALLLIVPYLIAHYSNTFSRDIVELIVRIV